MRQYLSLTTAVAALAFAAPALAQPAASQGAAVTVAIGPRLQLKAHDLGERELADLAGDLRDEVQHSIARSHAAPPVRVDLVLEDAVPNRPTFEQLSRTPSLSPRSIGVGGARISGTATYADGSQRPIREQYYETDLRDDWGATPWYDAGRAFDQAAYDIGRGRFPDKYVGPGPSGSGHFGYPFNDQ
jgi:hypothetical protein